MKIINSTEQELEKKYPWLAEADFQDAVIEDVGEYVIWKGGIWEGGWWEGGIWEDGEMWSNIDRQYYKIIQQNGKLIKEQND